ncbi:Putative DNA-directed RNA polymerase, M/15kDa subunit [Septoria linicola]|uniref:DNA-directed RNA polymerase, M/15kDa subunit n=1 Tax=Septoria linicola TaxID=215465 RepID=A0A9Q9AN21_9PEZI|nr:putative DNA-directed RNA polymerase, M/15kDa subunit [Septoria linicola]USW51980.1 Putative DNA-directed RNA polymerase, M/15kDa subunit [Septoria linicola]
MSAYDMDASPAPEAKGDDSKKISFRFCRECSNMLYPKEDRMSNTLMFACRTCQFSEPATASCIWRNSLKEDVQETAGNVDDVAQDPTVGNRFASDTRMTDDDDDDEEEDEDADIEAQDFEPEMCTMCGQEILCPICERPTDAHLSLEVPAEPLQTAKEAQEVVEAERQEREHGSA